MMLLYFYLLLLLLNSASTYGVSIRRRKHLFGERQELQQGTIQTPDQRQASNGNTDTQSKVSSPEIHHSISFPIQPEAGQNAQKKRKSKKSSERKSENVGVKPTYKLQKSWLERQKEGRDKGDPKAIAFFKKIYDNKARKVRERNERIRNGTATEKDQKQYLNYRVKQNQYRKDHRQERAESLRNWRANKTKKRKKKVNEG